VKAKHIKSTDGEDTIGSTASRSDVRGRTRANPRTGPIKCGSWIRPIRPRQPACGAGRPSNRSAFTGVPIVRAGSLYLCGLPSWTWIERDE